MPIEGAEEVLAPISKMAATFDRVMQRKSSDRKITFYLLIIMRKRGQATR